MFDRCEFITAVMDCKEIYRMDFEIMVFATPLAKLRFYGACLMQRARNGRISQSLQKIRGISIIFS
jgi:hypothetical protein